MLSENIKNDPQIKGLSQEELAVKLNVVRQTISKWEQGLSVPTPICSSRYLRRETPVSTLLGGECARKRSPTKKQSREAGGHQFAACPQEARTEKRFTCFFLILSVVTVVGFAALAALKKPVSRWNYADPETAVFGAAFPCVEFAFVRLAPFVFVASLVGA